MYMIKDMYVLQLKLLLNTKAFKMVTRQQGFQGTGCPGTKIFPYPFVPGQGQEEFVPGRPGTKSLSPQKNKKQEQKKRRSKTGKDVQKQEKDVLKQEKMF